MTKAEQETPADRDELATVVPLHALELRTPRMVLTPVWDGDVAELVALVEAGVHEPERMPFSTPWTDAPPEQLVPNTARHFWRTRAESRPERWTVLFVVRRNRQVVGIQELMAEQFAVTRCVETGSWLGRAFQGDGIGTEMRAAVLLFAFDQLGAERADSSAFVDNPASLRVSDKLGYQPDGTRVVSRRPGERALNQRLTVSPETFRRPPWVLQVAGFDRCRVDFGLPAGPGQPGQPLS